MKIRITFVDASDDCTLGKDMVQSGALPQHVSTKLYNAVSFLRTHVHAIKVLQVIHIKKERKLTDKAQECMPGQQSGWGCVPIRCLSSACIYESSKDILSMIFSFPRNTSEVIDMNQI